MAIENAQQMIPKIQAFFASQPIKKAWLFGSYSRGEERPDSDVDILVEYEDSDNISLFAISRMISSLKKILNKNVDLVEEGCILPFAENSVYKDRILIYEGKS
jgi:predicted nucleotidyltransferase